MRLYYDQQKFYVEFYLGVVEIILVLKVKITKITRIHKYS